MRYKILNKTILTSALVSLICFSAGSGLAQEVFDTESDDVLGFLPADGTEDDLIPVSGEVLITPQSGEVLDSQAKENASVPPASNDTATTVAPAPETASADVVLGEKLEAPIKADLLPMDDDFEIDFGDQADFVPAKQEPVQPQNELKKPVEVVKSDSVPQASPSPQKPVPATRPNIKQAETEGVAQDLTFGDVILAQTNDDLFNQMSDIEKQTTLLTLELKKEKIKNEIEAAKAVREKALFEKQASEEAQKRAQIEWEKEQEAKVIQAQAELKQKEIELEKLQQRKALTAYMNTMLEQKQSWVDENAKLYDEIKSLKNKNTEMRQSYQKGLNDISAKMVDLTQSAETAQKDHDRAIVSLTAQNTQLKKRIETAIQTNQAHDGNGNPFANGNRDGKVQTSADSLIAPVSVASEYAIVEILGQNDVLTVRLMNKDGDIFVAKKGTVLQSGHMVEEITPKFVRFSRNGLEDFLYTSGSPMEVEQSSLSNEDKTSETKKKISSAKAPVIPLIQGPQNKVESEDDDFNIVTETSLPSLGSTMFIK